MDADLRSARCFVVLAEERNYKLAAQRLGMAQPYLTRIIQHLEGRLGDTLIDRVARPLQLTDLGSVYYDCARRIMACVEECERRVRAHTKHRDRPIVVGFDQYAATELAPFLVDLKLTLRALSESADDDPIALVLAGKLHVALCESKTGYDGLNSVQVLKEPFLLAFPGRPKAPEGPCSVSALVPARLIVPGESQDRKMVSRLRQRLAQLTSGGENVLLVTSFSEALHLAAMGAGIAIVPSSYQRRAFCELSFRKITEPFPPSEVAMVWRDGSVPDELLSGLQSRRVASS